MAAARASITLVAIAVEHLAWDTGLWCNRCLLSTGVRHHVVCRYSDGRMRYASAVGCPDCGGTDIEQ